MYMVSTLSGLTFLHYTCDYSSLMRSTLLQGITFRFRNVEFMAW